MVLLSPSPSYVGTPRTLGPSFGGTLGDYCIEHIVLPKTCQVTLFRAFEGGVHFGTPPQT